MPLKSNRKVALSLDDKRQGRYGIPSHDTLGRVFSLIDPEEFQNAFLSWVNSLANLKGEFLVIDGKTARQAYEKGRRKGALHIKLTILKV